MAKEPIIGALGTFSKGKANPDDEGDLKIAVGCDLDKQLLYIHFGKPVAWIALDRADTVNLMKIIRKQLQTLKQERK